MHFFIFFDVLPSAFTTSEMTLMLLMSHILLIFFFISATRYFIEVVASAIYLKLIEAHHTKNLSNGWKKSLKLVPCVTIGK